MTRIGVRLYMKRTGLLRRKSLGNFNRRGWSDQHGNRDRQRDYNPAEHQADFSIKALTANLWNALATAIFAAVAFLLIVHRAILARFLAALLVSRKTGRTNHCREDRHQDFHRSFHVV